LCGDGVESNSGCASEIWIGRLAAILGIGAGVGGAHRAVHEPRPASLLYSNSIKEAGSITWSLTGRRMK
jgi:hypothetical protein